MTTSRHLDAAARRVARTLKRRNLRIVFAESCTAGLISATLARVPGISEFLCGSAVVYRVDTKQRWLGISAALLQKPGPVSRVVAAEMAERVLINTPEADVAASVTGHLGPNAPRGEDGLMFAGVAQRGEQPDRAAVKVWKHVLEGDHANSPSQAKALKLRIARQRAAAEFLLQRIEEQLNL